MPSTDAPPPPRPDPDPSLQPSRPAQGHALRALALAVLALVAVPALLALALAVFGWNWARAPLQAWALHKTGRALQLQGELQVQLAWPQPRITASDVSLANPPWARAPLLLSAERVSFNLDILALLQGQLSLLDVKLQRPQVFLENGAGGRRTWLLDPQQSDETGQVLVDRLSTDNGRVQYDDAAQQTSMAAEIHTLPATAGRAGAEVLPESVHMKAQGRFRGQPLLAEATGGAVLAWRDETHPYPVRLQARWGPLTLQARGSVTGLRRWGTVDLQLDFAGDSLSSLFALTGVALPPTPTYRSSGRLVRVGTLWRYGPFTAQVGRSDLDGLLQWQAASPRPLLTGSLRSRQLDLADLGPAVGKDPARTDRLLPDLALDTTHWAAMDADVRLQVQSLSRDRAHWVDGLQVRLRLQDRVLQLDPMAFDLAGGDLLAQVRLDGRHTPLQGQVSARLRGLKLARLLPAGAARRDLVGRLDGELDLRGQGPSIGRMLATADGRVQAVAGRGQVSRLLMERSGLHLLEIAGLTLLGDQAVALNCARLDFQVAQGVMTARTLVLDTAVNTLKGTGQVNLAGETLDLTVEPHTKVLSLVALRGPIQVRGTWREPTVSLDRARMVARGAGAVALGLVNPLLALLPLVDAGPASDPGCRA